MLKPERDRVDGGKSAGSEVSSGSPRQEFSLYQDLAERTLRLHLVSKVEQQPEG
jgi:hypothetical protein